MTARQTAARQTAARQTAAQRTAARQTAAFKARSTHRVSVAAGLLATIVTVGLAGCGHSSTGLARITIDGQAQVTPPNGQAHAAHSGDVLKAGDTVQVTVGDAAVRLLPSGVLQLRTGTQLVIGKTPRLASGAILIQAIGRAVQVSAQESTLVVPAGVAQLTVGTVATGMSVKVYQATSHLDIAGNPPTPIAAPRQITLTPQTRLPVQTSPLQYQDSDAWDHLYLASAEAISTQLGAAATGFNAQVPANQGKDAAFYQQLVPELSDRADFVSAFDGVQHAPAAAAARAAKPGDYLIASVIALRGTHGTFTDRLTNELAFSAQGAPWGFVAIDQGVADLTGVLNDVLAAIGRAALPFTGAPASQIAIPPPPSSPSTPTTRPSRPTTPTTRTTTTTTPANPRQPRPATPTTTIPPPLLQLPVPVLPGPLGAILNPLLDPLIQALNNILAGR
ncbi:MAG: hypothetical protein QOE15_1993 [Acidimicrobiaceae bacterium]|nr:hypothetical protein [Acidimicrobiaceae bacterium]